jgi:predicted transposase YbfD/YdcC
VPDKANELAAIPPLLARLGAEDGLKGALVSIDAIATNADIAKAITGQGADYLLAVKANQPTLRAEVEAAFAEAAGRLDTHLDLDKGHGRIEERRTAVLRGIDWLDGERRFPGELRLPKAACLVRAETRAENRVESRGTTRTETRYFIASRALAPMRPPPSSASIGQSRTACTGCSTSPSPTTSPASGKATAPETWPPSATSPSISSEPPPTSDPSSPEGRSPDGTPTTSKPSSHHGPPDFGFGALRRARG